jgi:hypothetical protein
MPKGKTPAGRRRHHEHSDASESETPYSSDGHISEADEALLDAAIAQNKQAALLATQRALRMKLKEAMCTTSSAASAASTDFDASSIADADAFQLEGLEEDLAEEAAMAAEELGIAADEAYLEELETRAAAIRGIASAREWIASARDAAEALAATAASKAEAAEAAEAAGMEDATAKAEAEEAQLASEEGRLAEMEATEAAEAAIAGAQARVLAAERRTADARRAAAQAAAAVDEAWIRSGRVVPGAERKDSFEELDEEAAIAAEEEAIAADEAYLEEAILIRDEAYLEEFATTARHREDPPTTARHREDPSPKPPTTAPSRNVGLHAALGLTLGLIGAAALWALQDAGYLPS